VNRPKNTVDDFGRCGFTLALEFQKVRFDRREVIARFLNKLNQDVFGLITHGTSRGYFLAMTSYVCYGRFQNSILANFEGHLILPALIPGTWASVPELRFSKFSSTADMHSTPRPAEFLKSRYHRAVMRRADR
jgi:hypothetical protein